MHVFPLRCMEHGNAAFWKFADDQGPWSSKAQVFFVLGSILRTQDAEALEAGNT